MFRHLLKNLQLSAITTNLAKSGVQLPQTKYSPLPETATASVTKDWYNYTAKDGSYTAIFPSQPQEENQSINSQVGEIKYLLVSYTDDTNNRFYFTLSTKYPVNPSEYNVEKGLDGARDGQAKSANMTVTSEKKISFNGIPVREITLQGSKGEAVLSRIFIDPEGPTLYQAAVVAGDGNLVFPEAEAFLYSLAIPK
jgi:hypothetical protein